jgi:hypothetical protein
MAKRPDPITLRLHWPGILRRARANVAQVDEGKQLQRSTKLAGMKALSEAKKAYGLEERRLRFMPERERLGWHKRRDLVLAELQRISGMDPP